MKMRNLMLMIGLSTCLFSTAFAYTNAMGDTDGFTQGEVNKNDPNVAMDDNQGAAGPTEYCEVCARLAAYRLNQKTAARAAAAGTNGTDGTWDAEGQR